MSTLPIPTLIVMIAGGMFVLYGVDKFLAGEEQSELQQEAANHYAAGRQWLHEGKADRAVAEFARAHAIERSSREYQLALSEAQIADHRLPAARETLEQVLEADSNDGRANLLMARVVAGEGQFKEADSYYHRAIFGKWPPKSPEPASVRLELVKMLAEHGSGNQELLSELLAVPMDAQSTATQKQIARLYLQAGSPARAAEVWTRLVSEDRDDVDASLGLTEAEIAAGNYHAAESALFHALRRHPYDPRILAQLRLVVKLASLDPTSRRLSSAEKYRRSVEILQLVKSGGCGGEKEKPAGPITNEAAEAVLDEAQSAWRGCKHQPAADDPLPLLMKKLSQ